MRLKIAKGAMIMDKPVINAKQELLLMMNFNVLTVMNKLMDVISAIMVNTVIVVLMAFIYKMANVKIIHLI